MDYFNKSNDKNYSIQNSDIYLFEMEICINTDSMESFVHFLTCLKYFLSKSILVSCLLLSFSLSTFLLNLAVILFINRIKQHKTVFDQIFIGHCIVDALVGILVIPNYCIYSVFGYWPLGKILCHFYVSLDYTICHVGIMHMVFIAYARLRSLLAPKHYHKEFLISNAKLTIFFLWIISGLLWLPAVNLIIDFTYKKKECYFNFNPVYIIMQDSVAYLLPMLVIIIITFYILKVLHDRNKRRKEMRKKRLNKLTKMLRENTIKKYNNKTGNGIILIDNISESEPSVNSNLNSINPDKNSNSTVLIPNCSYVLNNQQENLEECKQELNDCKKISDQTRSVSLRKPRRAYIKRNIRSMTISNLEIPLFRQNSFKRFSQNNTNQNGLMKIKEKKLKVKLNSYTKLYIIIATFCILWLPFCILWPVFSVCQTCISSFVYQISYWMGYAQSLINPILLLILNPNYNKLKSDY